MDCKIFRKRLNDLIEDNISYDLKDAMLQHISECEACRAVYEEELSLDETIRRGLSIDMGTFKSSRAEIMKSIDKNKYGTSPIKKLMNHLKKYRGTYTSLAALVAAAIFITPYLGKMNFSMGSKKSASMPQAPAATSAGGSYKNEAALNKVSPEIQSAKSEAGSVQDKKMAITEAPAYVPTFEKKALDKNYKPSFNTPWIDSANKKYSATLEGRGSFAEDEGVAQIIVKEQASGNQWSFNLLNNSDQQMSPRSIYWVDDKRLLVVVGLAQGHASQGGNLYMLNIDTAETISADPQNMANLQNGSVIKKVTSTKVQPDNQLEITVDVVVYEDSIQNKFHTESRIIVMPY